MRGMIIAGGAGTRLHPLTKITNKHLLPVYDKQMIFYPLETLKRSGIKDILIISSPGHAGQFLELLASGYDMGLNLSYTIQEKPIGIAHAMWIGLKEMGTDEPIVVMLGDNIIDGTIEEDIKNFKGGAKVFLKPVNNPTDFGVAFMNDQKVITKIVEKPTETKSNLAVVGLYIYDAKAYEHILTLTLSDRGEVEVTDLNNIYAKNGQLDYRILDGLWLDAGTMEGRYEATKLMRRRKMENE